MYSRGGNSDGRFEYLWIIDLFFIDLDIADLNSIWIQMLKFLSITNLEWMQIDVSL